MKIYRRNNYIIRVGTNSKENWRLIGEAKPFHYFFHLSTFPSCYVILEHNLNKVSDSIIIECAKICKMNTKYRNLSRIKVDYCLRDNVKKGDVVGEVIYKSNRKVKVVTI